MIVAILVFKITRPAPPPVSLINGTFKNTCCEEIRLANGYALFEGQSIPFRLVRDKNGLLVVELPRRLYASQGRVIDKPDADGGYLVFETDRGGFQLSTLEAPQTFDVGFQRVGA